MASECLCDCSVQKLCPVMQAKTLVCPCNAGKNSSLSMPVFTSLNYPYSSLSTAFITNIFSKAIKLVGLAEQGFSAKLFRPTGATAAIEGKMDPDCVRATGRWKSQECFETHYVHAKPPEKLTDAILLS